MHKLQFAVPVRIAGAPGEPIEEIYGVEQAMDILSEWPVAKQGKLYQKAFSACFGAGVGVVETEDARRAFAALCRVSGVMARDMMTPPKKRGEGRSLPR